jgi:hypothetical protein
MGHTWGEVRGNSLEERIIEKYLPQTLKDREDLAWFDKWLLADGYRAKAELKEMQDAFKLLCKLSSINKPFVLL